MAEAAASCLSGELDWYDCDTDEYACQVLPPEDINYGKPSCSLSKPSGNAEFVGNPINILNGNKYEQATDLILPSPNKTGIAFKRYYNSQATHADILGYGWTHSYSVNLTPGVILDSITHMRIEDNSGKGHYFQYSSGSRWDSVFKDKSYVIAEIDGTYTWHKIDGTQYGFNSLGQLAWMDDTVGNRQSFTYDVNNRLETANDTASGRTLFFHYTPGGLLEYISGPITDAVTDGIWVSYGYDAYNNLTSVTYTDGSGFAYEYTDPNDSHNLTAKKDKLGHVLATWNYDNQDRAYQNTTLDDRDVTINYDNYETQGTIEVTNAYGVTKTYGITKLEGLYPKVTTITGPGGCQTCAGDQPIRYEYDEDLNIIEEEYANGTINKYLNYDERGNPGAVILASGTTEERTITYTYHSTLNQPLTRSEASVLSTGNNKVTIWDFDNDGNAVANEAPTRLVYRQLEQGFTTDSQGAVVPNEYIITYQYNAHGQVLSINGPLPGTQDLTSFAYDPTTGDLTSMTLPTVGATSLQNYDGAGNPGQITDYNSQITTLTYDGRNRLLSSTINGITSSRSFNTAGELATVTEPGNRTLTYDYYLTGLLKSITDMAGDYLSYGYDAQGNRIKDDAYDNTGARKRQLIFDYQNPADPGRLWRIIYPDNGVAVMGYDSVGNLSSVTDPVYRTTGYQYNALNFLKETTQPGTVITGYGYDMQGNLATVIDPGQKETSQVFDDLGRPLTETSPDSGATNSYYDLDNNKVEVTDANGIKVTSAFDPLGRLTSLTFPDAAQNISFAYDQGVNGKGRLTTMTDPAGMSSYTYNGQGQLANETRTNYGMSAAAISYGYDSTSAELMSITYPSSLVVSYERDVNGRISKIKADGETIIKDIKYLPFGPAEDYTIGSDTTSVLTVDRTFNKRYQVDRILAGTNLDYRYRYYTDGSVWQIDGPPATIVSDAVTDYVTASGTNRIDYSIGAEVVNYSYDGNGNITGDGARTFIYNQNNRLIEVQEGGSAIAGYEYDGNGRRVKKVVSGVATYYHYDADDKLIAETDGSGNALRDYIYLGNEPMAVKVYGAQAGLYDFINDHLGTPQVLVDSTGTTVWQAAYLPFGKAQVQTGTVSNNLRFPGQYYDAETGLHYNWHRYYDPQTGRYLTPDPIGLAGGINLYSYTHGNPVNAVDPWGLATCRYSISKHTMVCTSNTAQDPSFVGPDERRQVGPEGVFSGRGECQDEPSDECVDNENNGPVVPGDYNMNEDNRPGHENWWRLEPSPKIPGWKVRFGLARGGFAFHLGSRSAGCINANKNNPDTANDFNHLHNLLKKEKGRNTLTVIP
ncbi:MAG: DUF2778 domain-containing protein [Proteobacteria bacterium]|nr:DUF2778 domain-containing protein [Pseudomonadota bacterium]MBU0967798.1 DUF2778 domain-containing protein [Pseudomonadota bacterium]